VKTSVRSAFSRSNHSRVIVWGGVFLVLFVVYFLMHVKLF